MSKVFLSVTELSGDNVTKEQVNRLFSRYYWAVGFCKGKDVLEVACGAGQGLGFLKKTAKTIMGCDLSLEILKIAKSHYGNSIFLQQCDAQYLPYSSHSKDIIILFEAIYYIPSIERFLKECKRVLRRDGKLLIATANKDLYDFNPSPYSTNYYGVLELNNIFSKCGFVVECFGNTPIRRVSLRQRLLRPFKKLAVNLNLIPKTSKGKKLLKRFVFGKLVTLPSEVHEGFYDYVEPTKLSLDQPDKQHKVIYCIASVQ